MSRNYEDIKPMMDKVTSSVRDAYNTGYAEGFCSGTARSAHRKDVTYAEGYNKGLEYAWKYARRIICKPSENPSNLDTDQLSEIFGTRKISEIFSNFTVFEVIAMIQKYDEEHTVTNFNTAKVKDTLSRKDFNELFVDPTCDESAVDVDEESIESSHPINLNCTTCKYESQPETEDPCSYCIMHDAWSPRNPRDTIKVGDEVEDGVANAIVTHINEDGTYEGLAEDGSILNISRITRKTGRSFSEIVEVLKQVKKGNR